MSDDRRATLRDVEELMREANEALAYDQRAPVYVAPLPAPELDPEWQEIGYLSTDGLHMGADFAQLEAPRPIPTQISRTISFTYPRRSGRSIMQQLFGDEWAAYAERQARRARLSGFERICEDLGYELPKPTLDVELRLVWPYPRPAETKGDVLLRLDQRWSYGVDPGVPARAWKAGVR